MSIKGLTPQQRRPRKPRREEKKIIKENNLDWKNWLIADEDKTTYTLENKMSGNRRIICK